jgi:tRNA dimethylallyltransferase
MIVDALSPCSVLLLGPTASGKTRLAVGLARALGGEILSADSRQLYRGLDIGSGKDLAEYSRGGPPVPVHLLDLVDPREEFSLFDWARAACRAAREVEARGRRPIFCGGSGLHLDALLRRYELREAPPDPRWRQEAEGLGEAELADRLRALNHRPHNLTDFEDRDRLLRAIEVARAGMQRPAERAAAPPCPVLGLRLEDAELRGRIARRLRARVEEGLLSEVEGLLASGLAPERLHRLGLEYRWTARRLAGELDEDAFLAGLEGAIWRFARQQRSWFRRMERAGLWILWLDAAGDPLEEALRQLAEHGVAPALSDIGPHA